MAATASAPWTRAEPLNRRDVGSTDDLPSEYVVDYPQAERCCPPIRSTFFEVTRSFVVANGRRFRQRPNGGYGLPIVEKVGDKHLLHVGADLGWYQVGEPVFAIANGVVRMSDGPDLEAKDETQAQRNRDDASMPWGNFVVIEHRFGANQYFTSIYGHLGVDRRVKQGDIVQAGQQIGTIGRQSPRINGGYKPHLHLGVREGRLAEVGATLLRLTVNGRQAELKLLALGKQWSEVGLSEDVPLPLRLTFNNKPYNIERREGQVVIPSTLLWQIHRPDFALVGYASSTEGWRDPVRFLRQHRADVAPAPYRIR